MPLCSGCDHVDEKCTCEPSKERLVYSEYEGLETIRQQPQNYLIAHKLQKRWVCDPDSACNKQLAIRLFNLLFDYDFQYRTHGRDIVNAVMHGDHACD